MRPYQEEYIENIKTLSALRTREEHKSFEEFGESEKRIYDETVRLMRRNMELLRGGLFPVLDRILEEDEEELQSLRDFAYLLLQENESQDIGLACHIHQSLLALARLRKDRNGIIRELYWLGMSWYYLNSQIALLESEETEAFISRMRLCFTEAAAYLKYFDQIEDTETKGYIIRSRGNIALGRFHLPTEKIRVVRQTLRILQDEEYRAQAPELPWDKFVYGTHQQMTASISYSTENPMSPQDVADVMESVYIIYESRFEELFGQQKLPALRSMFSYNYIEFQCGLETLEGLLGQTEQMMDSVNPNDYSADGMYGMISLPAFYCQFLKNNPEKISVRESYLAEIYRRIMRYIDGFPRDGGTGKLFFYIGQLSETYIEVEGGILYREFLRKVLMRFTPEIYTHSYAVGRAAQDFCELLLDEEPTFFDDIPGIREQTDPEKKRLAVMEYAMNCGLYHDAGKISISSQYEKVYRQWFEFENEIAQLHTVIGAAALERHPSTRAYAAAALGHHGWYDGSGGYPEKYRRLDNPSRQMVDVISLFSCLDEITNPRWLCNGVNMCLDEAIAEVIEQEGRRFSPLLTARLRERDVVERIRRVLNEARWEAHWTLYGR